MITRPTNLRTRSVGPPVSLLAALAIGLALSVASAQQIEPRAMAIEGAVESNLPTWETHIAAGYNPSALQEEHPVIALSHAAVACEGTPRIAFGIARKNHLGLMEWQQEGLIPVNAPYIKSCDPVIAFNSVTGDFLVAACVNDPVLSTDRLAGRATFRRARRSARAGSTPTLGATSTSRGWWLARWTRPSRSSTRSASAADVRGGFGRRPEE